jgi:rhomboid protease GluP
MRETARQMRDRLLGALLEPAAAGKPPAAMPLQMGPDAALLAHPATGPTLLVVPCEDEQAEAAMRRLEPVLDAIRGGRLLLLVTGGTDPVAEALHALPRGRFPHLFGVYHLDAEGRLNHDSGARLRGIERALAPLSTPDGRLDHPPLHPTRLAELLAFSAHERERERLFFERMRATFPWATIVLMAANVLVFALEMLFGGGEVGLAIRRMGANSGEWVRAGEPWRLLASAFLHGSVAHVVVNMIALLSFGIFLERILGTTRFLVLYGLSAIGGSLASALLQETVSVGASGAIWGLMLSGIGLTLRPGSVVPALTLAQMRGQAWLPLILNLLYSLQPGIDLWAHVGGGVVGLALLGTGLLTRGLRVPAEAPPEPAPAGAAAQAPAAALAHRAGPVLRAAAAALVLAMAVSVAAALATGRPWELLWPPPLERVVLPGAGLSLEVPATLGLRHDQAEGLQAFVFGNIERDPLAVEVLLARMDEPVPEGELEPALEAMRAELERQTPPSTRRLGMARVETVGRHRAVVFEEEFDTGARLHGWMTLLGDRQVLVRLYTRPHAPEAWRRLEATLFRSLRDEPAPAPGTGGR